MRRNFYLFLVNFWQVVESKEFTPASHIEYLCNEVQKVFEWVAFPEKQDNEQTYELIVNIAPGTSKSSIISKFGPAYLWTLNPDVRIISTSYSSQPVSEFTRFFTKIINSDRFKAFYPDIELAIDNVGKQTNNHNGVRFVTSTGGSITSVHGDILLVDDHNKPPRTDRVDNGKTEIIKGASVREMISANAWHDDALYTRRTDKEKSRFIYVQQRLHKDDLTGYLLNKANKGGFNVKQIVLPAQLDRKVKAYSRLIVDGKIKEEKNLEYLYIDNILDPNRMSKETLNGERAILGSYLYNAQYLQNPSQDTRGIINPDYFEIVDRNTVPDNLVKNFYSDTSEGKENSDNMATICWSLYEGDIYVWELQAVVKPFNEYIGTRDKTGFYNKKSYDLFVEKWGQNWQSKHYFEAKSSGSQYIQYINANTDYMAIEDIPKGSKLDRVILSQATFEARRIKLVRSVVDGVDDWILDLQEECRAFTGSNTDTDDRIDVLTGAVRRTEFIGSNFIQPKVSETEEISF